MRIEFRHLRTIKAIHDTGSLAGAADWLNMTQSALSHQIKGIEDQVGVPLFARRTKPLRLSAAGRKLLAAAEDILPRVDAIEGAFSDLIQGSSGRMHIAIECHACFEWLLPVLNQFRKAWPDVDLDIRPGLAFDALPALRREDVDLVVSSDPEDGADTDFTPLFDYAPVAVMAPDHPLAAKPYLEAADFSDQTLICYPVDKTRLDVFTQLLTPAKVTPADIRQVELTAVILMLVSSGRGIAVLPDWTLRQTHAGADYVTRPLTKSGITRRLYAATRPEDTALPFVAHLIRLARQEAVRLV